MQISVITATLMIKGAILALHQANITGNYSILRDMGTPVFRETFDQTGLAARFQNLRSRKLPLDIILLLAPSLAKKPELNANRELVFVGEFPTSPLRIQFNLAFMQLDGIWRLAGIGVDANASAAPPSALGKSEEQPKTKTTSTWEIRKQ